MKIFCKSCFAKVWVNFFEVTVDGRIWRTCNECGYSLCMGWAK